MFGAVFTLIKSVAASVIPSVITKLISKKESPITKEVINTKINETRTIMKTNEIKESKEIKQKKWYHFSFFYSGTDFNPPYFYMFGIYWVILSFCSLKFRYYWNNPTVDISETFILQLIGVLVGLFTLYNVYNPSSKGPTIEVQNNQVQNTQTQESTTPAESAEKTK